MLVTLTVNRGSWRAVYVVLSGVATTEISPAAQAATPDPLDETDGAGLAEDEADGLGEGSTDWVGDGVGLPSVLGDVLGLTAPSGPLPSPLPVTAPQAQEASNNVTTARTTRSPRRSQ